MTSKGSVRSIRFLSVPLPCWVLVGTDCAALMSALVLSYLVCKVFGAYLPLSIYRYSLPLLVLFPLFYALLRLYPGIFLHPSEEFKRLSLGTSLAFLLFSLMIFFVKSGDNFSRLFFLLFWTFSLIFIPTGRHLIRKKFCHKAWWESPLIAIGHSKYLQSLPLHGERMEHTGLRLVHTLSLCPPEKELPTYAQSFQTQLHEDTPYNEQLEPLAAAYPGATVFIYLPGIPLHKLRNLIDEVGLFFQHTMLAPHAQWLPCVPDQISSFQNTFCLRVRHNLADPRRKKLKRIIDLLFTLFFSICALPIGILIALCIKLDSKGPIFFAQRRIGMNGETFSVYKFRTMVTNADHALKEHLANDQAAGLEWQETQKLKKDPRITRVGKLLRKTSLDELPQVINILLGQMSFVGPRPIVADEIEKYGDIYRLYTRVRPGITGLWQVSGRNDTTYQERVALDAYYINNWSIWLDLYILFKTVPEVLFHKGAY